MELKHIEKKIIGKDKVVYNEGEGLLLTSEIVNILKKEESNDPLLKDFLRCSWNVVEA